MKIGLRSENVNFNPGFAPRQLFGLWQIISLSWSFSIFATKWARGLRTG